MHRNTKRQQLLDARAHAMRSSPTDSEAALFELLRARRLGVVVRRQYVVGQHIVDLAIPSVKLAVEVPTLASSTCPSWGDASVGCRRGEAREHKRPPRLGRPQAANRARYLSLPALLRPGSRPARSRSP
ncbi:MAG: DUF559 domain-containing protein [Polyangiaceae bacterium]|nr:DUF559 domain-containing protein [Polyangiaceae bacterium]